MGRKLAALAVAVSVLGLASGCGRKGGVRKAKVKWVIEVACPCLLAPALSRIVPLFRGAHPRIGVSLKVKGQEGLLPSVRRGEGRPDLLIVVGDLEVGELRQGGLVDYVDTFCFVALGLLTPSGNPKGVRGLKDLAKPEVEKVGLGAEGTTIGERAEELLKREGLWERVRHKVVRARFQMELVSLTKGGEYDASIGPASCALAGGGEAGLLLVEAFDRGGRQALIPCMGVVLKGARSPKPARIFLDFLVKGEAQAVLKSKGFVPLLEARIEGGGQA